jgi:hypothetical protein
VKEDNVMARDSLFGERIVWEGRCRSVTVPFANKVMGLTAAVVSVTTLLYAIVIAKSLDAPVGGMVLFAAWCAAIALGSWRLPLWWQSQVEYVVTERRVIWRRGPLRRSIDIRQISYALLRWSSSEAGLGDLVLVRAVPTGALRRTLAITLRDVEAPDRLWAIVRGVEVAAPLGSGDRPLAPRLDPGERVLWSGAPMASPWTLRRGLTAAAGLALTFSFVHSMLRSVPTVVRLLRLHALGPGLATALVGGVTLGMMLLLAVASGAAYAALVRPGRLARDTRYFVTNARVLIRRGSEELSLDRANIAYVIDAPWKKLHDVFLVLDGPKARALAPSGAFGGEGPGDALRPVLAGIEDAETVGQILRMPALDKAA